jgi:hypothetical protein
MALSKAGLGLKLKYWGAIHRPWGDWNVRSGLKKTSGWRAGTLFAFTPNPALF